MKTYPNSLRRHRKAAGSRQREVSIALGLGGSTERISRWENGGAMPKAGSLFRLAALYHVSAQELFDEMSRPRLDPIPEPTGMVRADENKLGPF